MKITKKEHKSLLAQLFIVKTGNFIEGREAVRQKEFSLDKLKNAGSAYSKLIESVDEAKEKYIDGEIEFAPGEVAILKDLFDEKKDWSVGDATFVLELKDIFDGK